MAREQRDASQQKKEEEEENSSSKTTTSKIAIEKMSFRELVNGNKSAVLSSPSSYHIEHPPSNANDGSDSTFWITTGLFPQELLISLQDICIIKKIDILCTGVREVEIAKCDSKGVNMNSWVTIQQLVKVDDADGGLQRLSPNLSLAPSPLLDGEEQFSNAPAALKAGFLRIRFIRGWTDTVAVYRVSILGIPSTASVKGGGTGVGSNVSSPHSLASRMLRNNKNTKSESPLMQNQISPRK